MLDFEKYVPMKVFQENDYFLGTAPAFLICLSKAANWAQLFKTSLA